MPSILLRGVSIIDSQDHPKADVLIADGIIRRIAFHDSSGKTSASVSIEGISEVIEADSLLLFPGLIDCHVHFREPGLEHKGTMQSESRSAIAGGVTTVCDMPNTIPPTVTVSALADKIRRAEDIKDCDIRFFFGATKDIHLSVLSQILEGGNAELEWLRTKLVGLKIYFDHSTGDQGIDAEILDDAFALCAAHQFPLVAHCEDAAMNEIAARAYRDEELIQPPIVRHSFMRPPESEAKAIEQAIALARKHGSPLHIAHLSTRHGIDLVRQAKADGLSVTCEVAPQHLFLSLDDVDGTRGTLGTLGKMNPPLRAADHVEALRAGIADGTVDCIATDHAPHTLEEKQTDDPLMAPSGVPGVETMLPLLLTVAGGGWPHPKGDRLQTTDYRLQTIQRLCFENPNRIFSLGKQGIAEGAPADLVLVDPHAEWVIRGSDLQAKCGWTPYEGWKVRGKVVRTID